MTAQIRIHDIPGGIHPPENKAQSTTRGVEQPPLPGRLILPLLQHIGVPAEPVVKVGDHVLKGQLLATAQGRFSCALHAPTSGTIAEIGPAPYPMCRGCTSAIVLDSDGEDRWIELEPIADYRALDCDPGGETRCGGTAAWVARVFRLQPSCCRVRPPHQT